MYGHMKHRFFQIIIFMLCFSWLSSAQATYIAAHPSTSEAALLAPNLPAVAYVNGWVGASLGGVHAVNSGGLLVLGKGGITFPLGHAFGIQADVFDGVVVHKNLQAADSYLFWRAPAQGFLSGHVKYQESNHVYETLYGLRGDAYIYNWTLSAEGGGVHTNVQGANETGYGEVYANWYPMPDLKLFANYLRVKQDNVFQVGGEYQLGLKYLPGLSIFVDGGVGDHNLRYGFLELRYYFGENKTLIRRHREDTVTPTFDPITFQQPARAVLKF